jgi:hypothetical protein
MDVLPTDNLSIRPAPSASIPGKSALKVMTKATGTDFERCWTFVAARASSLRDSHKFTGACPRRNVHQRILAVSSWRPCLIGSFEADAREPRLSGPVRRLLTESEKGSRSPPDHELYRQSPKHARRASVPSPSLVWLKAGTVSHRARSDLRMAYIVANRCHTPSRPARQ